MSKKLTYDELVQRVQELKQADEALREENEFLLSLIDNAPAFFVAIDAQGKTMMMNRHMLKTLNYETDEVVGKDYLSSFVPERDRDKLASVFKKLNIEHEHTRSENHIISKDGKEFLVEWHGRPVFDTGGSLNPFTALE